MVRPLRSDIVVSAEPGALEGLWRRVVAEQLGSRLRKVSFLERHEDDMERYGIPPDADIAASYAGPAGVANVVGSCFARVDSQGTLFVHWTAATMLTGRSKRNAVHDAIDNELERKFDLRPSRVR